MPLTGANLNNRIILKLFLRVVFVVIVSPNANRRG